MTESATAPEAALDDATLAGRARDGDVRAYEQLVVRYQGAMFRLVSRMLGSAADAEDATREIFLTAWRRIARLPDDSAFAAWLYRTAITRCLAVLRAESVVSHAVQAPSAAQVTTATQATKAGSATKAEERSAAILTSALQRLTPEQRAGWLLREVHGRSTEETASILGIEPAAVAGLITRARIRLAEVMTPWRPTK